MTGKDGKVSRKSKADSRTLLGAKILKFEHKVEAITIRIANLKQRLRRKKKELIDDKETLYFLEIALRDQEMYGRPRKSKADSRTLWSAKVLKLEDKVEAITKHIAKWKQRLRRKKKELRYDKETLYFLEIALRDQEMYGRPVHR